MSDIKMLSIGKGCAELTIQDAAQLLRITVSGTKEIGV